MGSIFCMEYERVYDQVENIECDWIVFDIYGKYILIETKQSHTYVPNNVLRY